MKVTPSAPSNSGISYVSCDLSPSIAENKDLLIYQQEFINVAIQAMCKWNRDCASISRGSFDRSWWGWKSRDFSDSSLQAAINLILPVAEIKKWDWMMPELLSNFVFFIEKLQHSDGSFDQCYPNERTPGVFYDILPALINVHNSKWLPLEERGRIQRVISKGLAYASSVDESHGEIANHLAHFAYGLALHWKTFGELNSLIRAQGYINRILENFNEGEGWFQEYHGPDPGYQTRALSYLTATAEILDDEDLWCACAKAARFVELMLMPDNSLHPMMGVRSTALIYPSGFERLAKRFNDFESLAIRVRSAWNNCSVALPSQLDFNNALRLGEDAFAAFTEGSKASIHPEAKRFFLSENDQAFSSGLVHLPQAGILIIQNDLLKVWCAWRLGGVLVIWRRLKDGTWVLAHEDSGYLLKANGGTDIWVTRMANSGRLIHLNSSGLSVEAVFNLSIQEEMTPLRLVVLRLLNLTILRNQYIGDVFRRLVAGKLSGLSRSIGVRVLREICFEKNLVHVKDSFSAGKKLNKSLRMASLWRCRRVMGNHMASARYFQASEGVFVGPSMDLQSKSLSEELNIEFKILGEP